MTRRTEKGSQAIENSSITVSSQPFPAIQASRFQALPNMRTVRKFGQESAVG
jgi:hypothetical protein